MIIYVIERLIKRKWHPLSFIFSTPQSNALGLTHQILPCHSRSLEKAEIVLKIATETFKDQKFRVQKYRRI